MPSKKKLGENEMPKEKKDKKGNYKILPVRPADDFGKIDRELPIPLQSMFKKNGGVLAIMSPPGSGKSNFLSSLLLQDNLLKDFFHGGLYLISPTCYNDLTSRYLVDYADFVSDEFSEEMVQEIFKNIMNVPKEDREYCCLVFDDCMGSLRMNTFCSKMASCCRHMKSLQIYSTQSVKSLPPNLRSNISHTITFYQPSNKQLNDICELHSCFGGEKVFLEKYKEACGIKYGFLLSDFRDMKLYAWGADRQEPIEIYSRYNEDGTINMEGAGELNKGNIKSSD
jgi:hypothetical protein